MAPRPVYRLIPFAAALCLATGLAGCSTGRHASAGVGTAVTQTSTGMSGAVSAPLTDLNITRVEVPPLLAAIRSPYEPLAQTTCEAIAAQVTALTQVLGPDTDAPAGPDKSVGVRAGEEAADFALDSVESTVTGFIPFRSIVRQATGATAHERRLRDAYVQGTQKRAYLKGVGASKGCAPPAAPNPDAGAPVSNAPRR
jgi:hypothetical protein